MPIIESAPAKLNLYLNITGKRPDGYHLLDSLTAFVTLEDTLEIHPAANLSLEITGEFAEALQGEPPDRNLVWKAAELLRRHGGETRGARMLLHKRIPVAAGLGGGSADAAAAIRGLRRLWEMSTLPDVARLGSDIPVCLASTPTIMRGVGDKIIPAPTLPPAWVTLVNPRIMLSTAEVYHRFGNAYAGENNVPIATDFVGWMTDLRKRRNMLEEAAMALCPAIADVLAALHGASGCALARMAGSGATCFGLFEHEKDARAAAEKIKHAAPGWWVAACGFRAGPKQ